MFIRYKYLLSAVLLLGLAIPIFSFQASGGVLSLDGEDDYAILRLPEHGYLFPKNTDEFTVEAWFYPKSGAGQGKPNIILTQQVRIALAANNSCRGRIGNEDQICSYGSAYLEGGGAHGITGINAVIKKDQWNYMAVIFKDSIFHLAYNDKIVRGKEREFMNFVAGDLNFRDEFKHFFVGGAAEDAFEDAFFHGEIDAIRFSDIARYDLPAEGGISPFNPPHRFINDAHTLALWNFNDKKGADRFEDTSGNGKTLTGMNGATIIDGTGLEIRPQNALTATWGQIKSDPF